MPNISRKKENQTLKFGQKIFFKNHTETEVGRLVPDLLLAFKKALYELFLVFKKALYEVKANVCGLVSITFNSPQLDKELKQNI